MKKYVLLKYNTSGVERQDSWSFNKLFLFDMDDFRVEACTEGYITFKVIYGWSKGVSSFSGYVTENFEGQYQEAIVPSGSDSDYGWESVKLEVFEKLEFESDEDAILYCNLAENILI